MFLRLGLRNILEGFNLLTCFLGHLEYSSIYNCFYIYNYLYNDYLKMVYRNVPILKLKKFVGLTHFIKLVQQ